MNTVPFPQLQSFLAVARHWSFSGAARELGVSRSVVSQSLRQLEEQAPRGAARADDAGRRLVANAGPSLGQVEGRKGARVLSDGIDRPESGTVA
ncbi:MAG TPA: LysR family transcriptional regulator [Polyangiaceae bacterium]|nr:LysR family transcriptional regulator [Polyangiaceae bacterium]